MTPKPPLLMLAEGGRPRPRRCPLSNPRELVLHRSTVDVLEKLAKPTWQWSHFPAYELRDVRSAARLKSMGLKRGWPDIIAISPTGRFHGLELKRVGEDLTEDQESFQGWAIRHGVAFSVARTLDEVISILSEWGAIIKVSEAS